MERGEQRKKDEEEEGRGWSGAGGRGMEAEGGGRREKGRGQGRGRREAERLVKAVKTLQLGSGGFAGRSWQSEGGEGRGQLAAPRWGREGGADLNGFLPRQPLRPPPTPPKSPGIRREGSGLLCALAPRIPLPSCLDSPIPQMGKVRPGGLFTVSELGPFTSGTPLPPSSQPLPTRRLQAKPGSGRG